MRNHFKEEIAKLLKDNTMAENYYQKTIKVLNLKVTELAENNRDQKQTIKEYIKYSDDLQDRLKRQQLYTADILKELKECKSTKNTSSSMIVSLMSWFRNL